MLFRLGRVTVRTRTDVFYTTAVCATRHGILVPQRLQNTSLTITGAQQAGQVGAIDREQQREGRFLLPAPTPGTPPIHCGEYQDSHTFVSTSCERDGATAEMRVLSMTFMTVAPVMAVVIGRNVCLSPPFSDPKDQGILFSVWLLLPPPSARRARQ
jgi:hypothetical protein